MPCFITVNTELDGLSTEERVKVIEEKIRYLRTRNDLAPPYQIEIESLKLEEQPGKPKVTYSLSHTEIEQLESAVRGLKGVIHVERQVIRRLTPTPQIVLFLKISFDNHLPPMLH